MNNEKTTKIRQIMRKYDLTYQQIARLVDLSITTVRYWNYTPSSFTAAYEFILLHKLRTRAEENITKLDKDILSLKD